MSDLFKTQCDKLLHCSISWSEIFNSISRSYILFDKNFDPKPIPTRSKNLLFSHANKWKKQKSGDYFIDWLLCVCVILDTINFIVEDLCTDAFSWYHRFIVRALSPDMINLACFHSKLVSELDWACRWHHDLPLDILYSCGSATIHSHALKHIKKIMIVRISEQWPREVCERLFKNKVFLPIMKTRYETDSKCVVEEIATSASSHAKLCRLGQTKKEIHELRQCRCVCSCSDCWFRPCHVLADQLVYDLTINQSLRKSKTSSQQDVQEPNQETNPPSNPSTNANQPS